MHFDYLRGNLPEEVEPRFLFGFVYPIPFCFLSALEPTVGEDKIFSHMLLEQANVPNSNGLLKAAI